MLRKVVCPNLLSLGPYLKSPLMLKHPRITTMDGFSKANGEPSCKKAPDNALRKIKYSSSPYYDCTYHSLDGGFKKAPWYQVSHSEISQTLAYSRLLTFDIFNRTPTGRPLPMTNWTPSQVPRLCQIGFPERYKWVKRTEEAWDLPRWISTYSHNQPFVFLKTRNRHV